MKHDDHFKTDSTSVGAAVDFLLARFAVSGEPEGEAWSDEIRGAAIQFGVEQTALESTFVATKGVITGTEQKP